MIIRAIISLCIVVAALSGCRETATTPTLPPLDQTTTSRPAAAIQNTEVMDQSIMNAAQGKQ